MAPKEGPLTSVICISFDVIKNSFFIQAHTGHVHQDKALQLRPDEQPSQLQLSGAIYGLQIELFHPMGGLYLKVPKKMLQPHPVLSLATGNLQSKTGFGNVAFRLLCQSVDPRLPQKHMGPCGLGCFSITD